MIWTQILIAVRSKILALTFNIGIFKDSKCRDPDLVQITC